MTTKTTDESAERLRTIESFLWDETDGNGNHVNFDDRVAYVREAFAAERRATVERIQSNVRLVLLRHHVSDEDVATCDVCTALSRAIHEEAVE